MVLAPQSIQSVGQISRLSQLVLPPLPLDTLSPLENPEPLLPPVCLSTLFRVTFQPYSPFISERGSKGIPQMSVAYPLCSLSFSDQFFPALPTPHYFMTPVGNRCLQACIYLGGISHHHPSETKPKLQGRGRLEHPSFLCACPGYVPMLILIRQAHYSRQSI